MVTKDIEGIDPEDEELEAEGGVAAEAEDEEEEAQEEAEEEKGSAGGVSDLLDDIFADEPEENDKLKAFGDLEHLTMVEVASEVEAVLEELKLRQGGYE